MIIIVDGPRCTGKTTLAHMLMEDLNSFTLSTLPQRMTPDGPGYDLRLTNQIACARRAEMGLIFDTFHFTLLLQGYPGDWRHADDLLAEQPTLLLLLTDNPIEIAARLQRQGEMIDRAEIGNEIDNFAAMEKMTRIESVGSFTLPQWFKLREGTVIEPTSQYDRLIELIKGWPRHGEQAFHEVLSKR